MEELKRQIYQFEEFELDVINRELRRAGERVQLPAKAFDLLLVLIENNNRLLGKDEIFERVWRDQIVEESNLTVHISAIRKALGEAKNKPRFITTIPGYGYRFSGEVTIGDEERNFVIEEEAFTRVTIDRELEVSGEESRLSPVDENQTTSVAASPPKTTSPREMQARVSSEPRNKMRLAVLIVCALLVLLLPALVYFQQKSSNQQQASSRIKSIAVLPFKPLVVENRNESLEIGMADTLIAKLSNLKEINIRPISAVRKYSGVEQDAVAAGREQKVDAVLDGQIQKFGDKIRVTVRLIRIEDAATIWTNQFDEKMSDIFGIQDSISERVTAALALKLSGEQKSRIVKRHTENTQAYELYLLGKFHFAKRTREALGKSIEYFNEAIEKDPNYALAYVGLGAAYSTSGWNDFIPPHEAYPKAKNAIDKALQLDDAIADAYAVSGNIKRGYDWDLAGAEIEYRRALELDPNNPTTYQWYGLNAAFAGRHDESITLFKRARELDPLSMIINKSFGDILSFARRFDEAIEQYHRVLELHPDFPNAYRELGTCYYYKNLHDKAFENWLKGVSLSGSRPQDVEALKSAYKRSGMKGFWLELAEQIKQSKESYIPSYDVATCYAAGGDKQQALDWLERAYQEHSSGMVVIKAELMFDNIRTEPRFIELMRRVGLPQ
ncbi:MAG: winged helix-turn-helix domain-containing protein [Acidobacteriota bacterium]|nr:winged helix-turn-helix domain-containing protein [Acidobacteriota bacterium]